MVGGKVQFGPASGAMLGVHWAMMLKAHELGVDGEQQPG
jgi:hypothetical protein